MHPVSRCVLLLQVRVCVCVCVRACVRARARVRACVCARATFNVCVCVCLLVTTVNHAKLAEPIEVLFGASTRVGPRNRVLAIGQIPD